LLEAAGSGPLELSMDGRKNGAFSGALGASLGLLRSCLTVSLQLLLMVKVSVSYPDSIQMNQ
jgi:hypothetical protein